MTSSIGIRRRFAAVAPEKPAAASPASPHTCVKAATPLVTFKREGDRVTQIHIQCPCGQIVVLDCEY